MMSNLAECNQAGTRTNRTLIMGACILIVATLALCGYLLKSPRVTAWIGLLLLTVWALYSWAFHRGIEARQWLFLLIALTGLYGVELLAVEFRGLVLFPYRVLVLGGFAVGMLRWLSTGATVGWKKNPMRWYLTFLSLWLGYALISLLWTPFPSTALREVALLSVAVGLLSMSILWMGDKTAVRYLFGMWVAAIAVFAIVGWVEMQTGGFFRDKIQVADMARRALRPRGPFHNTNDFATLLALGAPAAIVGVLRAKRYTIRIAALVALVLVTYLILAAGSRANFLALLLELAAAYVLFTTLAQRMLIGFSASMGLLLMYLLNARFLNEVLGVFQSLFTQVETMVGSVATRWTLLGKAALALLHSYGFGVGAGSVEPWIARQGTFDTRGVSAVHNWWMEILANYGVFIFVGYLVFFVGLFRALLQARRRFTKGVDCIILESLILGLIGFTIASVSSSSIMALRAHWLFMALALAFVTYARTTQEIEI